MDDIQLKKVEYIYQTLWNDAEEKQFLEGLHVKFRYKDVKNCEVFIPTKEELTIYKIKQRIMEEIRK